MSMGRVSSNGVKERIGQLVQRVQAAHGGSGGRPPVHRSRPHGRPRHPCGGAGAGSRGPVGRGASSASDEHPRLPVGKTWDTFEHDRVPVALRQQLVELADGSFVERGVNVLAFGLPGTGKTHALCAIGHRLVESGRSVLFTPAYRLVQDMLAAKRDLDLPRMLRKLDNIDFLLIDDLGYLPQGAEESEVLFTLIAERYERRSLGITSSSHSGRRSSPTLWPLQLPLTGSSTTRPSWSSTSPAIGPGQLNSVFNRRSTGNNS